MIVNVRLCFVFFFPLLSATQYEPESGTAGKAVKGRLGSLYNLRNKLSRSPDVKIEQFSNSGRRVLLPPPPQPPPPTSLQQKESRGYAFHRSPDGITNPMFTHHQSYSSRDFHSRMGKVSDSSSKWKSPEKNMDKYLKYAYQVDSESSWKSGNSPAPNSFNIHQLEFKNGSGGPADSKSKVKTVLVSSQHKKYSSSTTTTTSTTTLPPTTAKSFGASGFDISPIKALGQGLNSAMTTVLTQKLMGIIDQEVPLNFLNPLKHLVSSGQRMVEFWDKRANARDGKAPGIVEMFGFGIEQLKRYRDGQAMLPSDPVVNITSASKTMIEGMLVVKKLTNRVLGYDTDDKAIVESRGGYDHGGGWGWGHHMSYGGLGGLDPFALLAALAFGAFLLQLLLTLLNTSQRSLDVVDMNVPLLMSDYHVPNIMTRMDKIFGTPTIRTKRSVDEDSTFFNSVVDKLDGMYKTYKLIKENPTCGRLYICRAAVQDPTGDENGLLSQLYSLGLGQFSGDVGSMTFMKSIKERASNGEDIDCDAEAKGCAE